jgi:glycosyltransferase involved in cell wall biosynthesis
VCLLKIAVINSGHIPSRWAHSITTMKMADAFCQLGHEVCVLTIEGYQENKEKITVGNVNDFYAIDNRIKIKYFTKNPLFYYEELPGIKLAYTALYYLTKSRIRYCFDIEKEISLYCIGEGFDFCYARTLRTTYYNVLNKMPTILETHSPEIRNKCIRDLAKCSDEKSFLGIVTISDVLRSMYTRIGVPNSKIMVFDDGVNLNEYDSLERDELRRKLNLPLNRYVALYSGNLYEGRGIEYIIEACKLNKEVLFVFIGGFEKDINKWKQKVVEAGIANVEFLGFVPHKFVPHYLVAADLLLMPYTRDTSTYQWMSPLKLFEYLAAGKPIIASKLEAIERILTNDKNAILVPEKNGEAIANAVEAIKNNPSKADWLSKNAKQSAEKYSWKARAKRVIEYYENANRN